jgi:hypothetical protein
VVDTLQATMGFSKAAAFILVLSLFASANAEIYFNQAVPPSKFSEHCTHPSCSTISERRYRKTSLSGKGKNDR